MRRRRLVALSGLLPLLAACGGADDALRLRIESAPPTANATLETLRIHLAGPAPNGGTTLAPQPDSAPHELDGGLDPTAESVVVRLPYEGTTFGEAAEATIAVTGVGDDGRALTRGTRTVDLISGEVVDIRLDPVDASCDGDADAFLDCATDGCRCSPDSPFHDCAPADDELHPGAVERCEGGADEDCDGATDELGGTGPGCGGGRPDAGAGPDANAGPGPPCTTDGDCADEDPCTVNERCDDGVCRFDAKDCDDGAPCTDDSCNPDNGLCEHDPLADGAPCDDGDPCTVDDTCASGVCEPGPPSAFEKAITGEGGTTRLWDLAVRPDGGFAAVGRRSSPDDDDSEGHAWLVLYASDGSVQSSTRFGPGGSEQFTAVLAIDAGTLVAAGVRDEPSGTGTDGWLARVNTSDPVRPQLDDAWTYDETGDDTFTALTRTHGLIPVGSADGEAWVVRAALDGEEVWSRRTNTTAPTHLISVTRHEGRAIAGGVRVTDSRRGQENGDAWLVSFTLDAPQLDAQSLPQSTSVATVTDLQSTPSGKVVAVGGGFGEATTKAAHLWTLSSQLEVVDSTTFGNPDDEQLLSLASLTRLEQGDLVAAGFRATGHPLDSSTGWLTRLDTDGVVEWETTVGDNGANRLRALEPAPSKNGVVGIGGRRIGSDSPSALLFKSTVEGQLQCGDESSNSP